MFAQPARRTRELNGTINGLAARQHGVVARAQLDGAGVSDGTIAARLSAGWMRRVVQGVYRVGPLPLSDEGNWMAAVLAHGPGAVLSHRSAAVALGLLEKSGSSVDVTRLDGGSRRRLPRMRLHRTRNLPPEETCKVKAIPVTSVARTLADLAGVASSRQLADAVSAARRLNRFDASAIRRILDRAPMRRGAGRLRKLVDQFAPLSVPSLSELQDRVLLLLLEAGLPTPQIEVRAGNRIFDFLWEEEMVILEVDGYEGHRHKFDADRDRDLDHAAEGYRTVRVTYWMIEDHPQETIERLRRVLEIARSEV